jgi:DNA-binding transcriptional regulator YhcF (GntR family)
MNTFVIQRHVIIRCANECGLGGLLMLLSIQINTYGGTCGASARQLAATACVHPTTAAKHLRNLANGGFVKGRVWRDIIQSGDGDAIEMDGDKLKQFCDAGDVLALAVLLEALVDGSGTFLVEFTKLAELAGCSLNTAKKLLREAEARELAAVKKSGWGEVQIVPTGTLRQKTERVREANPHRLHEMAIANLRGRH